MISARIPTNTISLKRAQILSVTRQLLLADMELMEGLGNLVCDYCGGPEGEEPYDGHSVTCPFADAVEAVFQPRAVGDEAIKAEALQIRDALVTLVAADYHMMAMDEPCPYCDSDLGHEDDCVMKAVLEVLTYVPRSELV